MEKFGTIEKEVDKPEQMRVNNYYWQNMVISIKAFVCVVRQTGCYVNSYLMIQLQSKTGDWLECSNKTRRSTQENCRLHIHLRENLKYKFCVPFFVPHPPKATLLPVNGRRLSRSCKKTGRYSTCLYLQSCWLVGKSVVCVDSWTHKGWLVATSLHYSGV
jgi:hypothetical protein